MADKYQFSDHFHTHGCDVSSDIGNALVNNTIVFTKEIVTYRKTTM